MGRFSLSSKTVSHWAVPLVIAAVPAALGCGSRTGLPQAVRVDEGVVVQGPPGGVNPSSGCKPVDLFCPHLPCRRESNAASVRSTDRDL